MVPCAVLVTCLSRYFRDVGIRKDSFAGKVFGDPASGRDRADREGKGEVGQQPSVTRLALIIVLCGFARPVFAAQDSDSGDYMLPVCRALAEGWRGSWKAREREQGQCQGIMGALMAVGRDLPEHSRFCRPEGNVVNGEVRSIVVNYLLHHPEKLHERFVSLTLEAFHEAWPCP